MSRTYKTRPEWVKLNDPKFPTKEHHQHYVVKREKSGRMIKQNRTYWRFVDGWPKTETVEYEVPHYYTWVEAVPCSIDIPEKPWRDARHDRFSNNREKLCDKRPLVGYSCSCCSRRYAKGLSNGAQRAKIKQEIKKAINRFGFTTDTDPTSFDIWPDGSDDYGTVWKAKDRPNWWDVDITTANISEDWDSWD